MQEVVIVVKCGAPLSKWSCLFASGAADPIIFQEQTEIQLKKYCPTGGRVVHVAHCKNSVNVAQNVRDKLDAGVVNADNKSWASTNLTQLKRLISQEIQKE